MSLSIQPNFTWHISLNIHPYSLKWKWFFFVMNDIPVCVCYVLCVCVCVCVCVCGLPGNSEVKNFLYSSISGHLGFPSIIIILFSTHCFLVRVHTYTHTHTHTHTHMHALYIYIYMHFLYSSISGHLDCFHPYSLFSFLLITSHCPFSLTNSHFFTFGCPGSSLLCVGFLQLSPARTALCCGAWGLGRTGFGSCGPGAH